MKTNIKIKVTPKQSEQIQQIQQICFDNGIYWEGGEDKNIVRSIPASYLYIDDHILFGNVPAVFESSEMEEVQADFFIETYGPYKVPEGTIVKAIRKDGYETQAIYYAKCGNKHAVDFNGTSAMIVDEVEVIQTLTKKEAKQKVLELFSNIDKFGNINKSVSSYQIRNIIDLIK